jgi:NADH-quinone oxidoreductase subunit I
VAYFRDIYSGISTILIGMRVTFRHLFMPTITVQYPREKLPMFPRTRARLVNHEAECGVCLSCEKICPAGCFTIKGVRAEKDEDLGILPDGKPKKMHVVQFDINMSTCLYCGLCVDACDTKSLRWEQPQEDSSFIRRELIKDFVTMPPERKKELLDREAARKAARAAAGPPKPPVAKGTPKASSEASPESVAPKSEGTPPDAGGEST